MILLAQNIFSSRYIFGSDMSNKLPNNSDHCEVSPLCEIDVDSQVVEEEEAGEGNFAGRGGRSQKRPLVASDTTELSRTDDYSNLDPRGPGGWEDHSAIRTRDTRDFGKVTPRPSTHIRGGSHMDEGSDFDAAALDFKRRQVAREMSQLSSTSARSLRSSFRSDPMYQPKTLPPRPTKPRPRPRRSVPPRGERRDRRMTATSTANVQTERQGRIVRVNSEKRMNPPDANRRSRFPRELVQVNSEKRMNPLDANRRSRFPRELVRESAGSIPDMQMISSAPARLVASSDDIVSNVRSGYGPTIPENALTEYARGDDGEMPAMPTRSMANNMNDVHTSFQKKKNGFHLFAPFFRGPKASELECSDSMYIPETWSISATEANTQKERMRLLGGLFQQHVPEEYDDQSTLHESNRSLSPMDFKRIPIKRRLNDRISSKSLDTH